jgi:hypothetical protein
MAARSQPVVVQSIPEWRLGAAQTFHRSAAAIPAILVLQPSGRIVPTRALPIFHCVESKTRKACHMTFRERLRDWLETSAVRNFVLAVIIFNAMILGMETSAGIMATAGPVITLVDHLCLAFFVAELMAKLIAHGRGFFRNGWNLFDFLIVGI